MSYNNTVIALLTIAIFTVAAHEMRDQVRAAEHAADCAHHGDRNADHNADRNADRAAPPEIRVARVSKAALVAALGEPGHIASLLGLESRGPLANLQALAALAYGDASHAVMAVAENGRVVQLVVLAE